jgi:hypothetical protein
MEMKTNNITEKYCQTIFIEINVLATQRNCFESRTVLYNIQTFFWAATSPSCLIDILHFIHIQGAELVINNSRKFFKVENYLD